MNPAPQIRLRTVFLLFFCAAVGLTTSSNPFGAIRATVETTIVIGLLQQARQLLLWPTRECNNVRELAFTRRFATFWRVAVAIILGVCVIWRLLLARKFIGLPEQHNFIPNPFEEGLPQVCVLIALCNSLTRWRSARSVISFRAIRAPFLWILSIAIALVMLVEGTTIEYLVHRATSSIERSQRFPRTGLFVQLSAEGYDAIWYGFSATACMFAAIALVTKLGSQRRSPRARRCRWLVFPLLLIPPTAFCIWYHRYEFYRLSPDMAGVGLALTLSDLLAGALLAAVAITAGAYQLATSSVPMTTISADLSIDLDRRAFHESFVVLLLLALNACGVLYSLVAEILTNDLTLGGIPYARLITYFCYPPTLLGLATLVVTVQLCWLRWKTRFEVIPWKLLGLSPQLFGEGWIMLALLVVVGIPTIRAFVFLLWLGPFNLPSFFGY